MHRLALALAVLSLPVSAQVSVSDNEGKTWTCRDLKIAADGKVTLIGGAAGAPASLDAISEVSFDERAREPSTNFEVYLNNANSRMRDRLSGELADATDPDNLRLMGTDAADIEFPLNFARSLRAARSIVDTDTADPASDTIWYRRDKVVDKDAGTLVKLGREGVTIESNTFASERIYKLDVLEAISFAGPKPAQLPEGIVVTVSTKKGMRVSGRLLEMTERVCRVQTSFASKDKPWVLDIAANSVLSIYVMNGNLVYLSDMSPRLLDTWHHGVGETPAGGDWFFLDRQVREPLPITIHGRMYRKGISTRRHVQLEFDLAGGFRKFSAAVGLTSEAEPNEYVDPKLVFSVVADGKVAWTSKVMSWDLAGEPVSLNVSGVGKLVLVTEVVDGDDCLPYGAWADARVVK